jgi:hypothetical protein
MSRNEHFFTPLLDRFDLTAFGRGHEELNRWLIRHASTAVSARTAGVYRLIEGIGGRVRFVGYHAIAPTSVVRQDLPRRAAGGSPDPVPFLIARLALDRSHRGDKAGRWGTQLVVDALRRILAAASVSGGRVIVVDADNSDLAPLSGARLPADPVQSVQALHKGLDRSEGTRHQRRRLTAASGYTGGANCSNP